MRWLAVAFLMVPMGAQGASGKVGKAIKLIEKFDAGERGALDAARKAADQGVEKSPEDAEAWAVQGRVYLLYVTNADLARPEGDPATLAVDAFEKAVGLGAAGAVHGQLSSWVPMLESAVVTALRNDVEGKQWDAASSRLDLALRVRTTGEKLGNRDDAREQDVRRLAVQITARTGRLDEARHSYDAFVDAAKRHEPGLATLVARELAETGDVDGALAFLATLDDELPEDERLLRTQVDLLVGASRDADAVARIDKAAESLQTSVSGAFLAASLYDVAGATERARELWARTIELDARHYEANLLLGRSLYEGAKLVRAELDASEDVEMVTPPSEVEQLAAAFVDLCDRADASLRAAHEVDSRQREPVEALIAVAEIRLANLDGEESADARKTREATSAVLVELRAALAALEN